MRRKYGRIRKTENVIVFPGTYERLVERGLVAVEQSNFNQAVEVFDQAILYEPDYPEFLGPYAVALYETKEYERAKEIAARLLHSGATDYIDAMELYLTISIQLQEYEEVEMTIDTLIGEGIVPHDMLPKFSYLRELNGRLSNRYVDEEQGAPVKPFTLEEFNAMDKMHQQYALASLEGMDFTEMIPQLTALAERDDVEPMVISFVLALLQQAGYAEELTIRKFGWEMKITPSNMTLPGRDDVTGDVRMEIERLLLKDPSRLEMAQGLIEKYAITAFPFGWNQYPAQEVAIAYVNYIDSLFSGEQLPETELYRLIQQIDSDRDGL